MHRTRVSCGLILIFALIGCSTSRQKQGASAASAEAPPASSPSSVQPASAPSDATSGVVRASMQNVEFHLTDGIFVRISSLNGRLVPKPGAIPVFDDKTSFGLDVDSASVTLTTTALTNDLNDYVFASADAPLKKLSASIKDDQLVVKGILASKGGIPFETAGTMSVTPEGMIHVHTTKVSALHLPMKKLMDLVGLDTQKLINTNKVKGVRIEKDDLILDPEDILPPPQLHGHLISLKVENSVLNLVFGPQTGKPVDAPFAESCGARNYMHFKGGSVRFGKLTMTDGDLELMDVNPADPFDFAIDHYNDQLVAGFSKMTPAGGLCVHMPDYNTLNQHAAPAAANK